MKTNKGIIKILHPYTTTDEKIKKEREKVLQRVLTKLSKKNIQNVLIQATESHTIINYEVVS